MLFSGIADEAGKGIAAQIRAHKELGFEYIELRCVDGVNITQLPDKEFNQVLEKITAAGLIVSAFASKIGDWSRPISRSFDEDVNDLWRAIHRMKLFGTRFIRVMSWPNDKENPVSEAEWQNVAVARMRVLSKIAEEAGIILLHENCAGWGGQSPEHSDVLLSKVDSNALRVLFDTGNPVTYGQNAWDYYWQVKGDIGYIHIKDARRAKPGEENENGFVYTDPGEGDGRVKDILRDILKTGILLMVSIEPHRSAVIHTGQTAPEEAMYSSYIQYGEKLKKIVAELRMQM